MDCKDDLTAEYRAGLARHGFTIAPDREAEMFEGFLAFRKLMSLLDKAVPYAVEPGPGWTPDMVETEAKA